LVKIIDLFEVPSIITAREPDGFLGPVMEVVTKNLPNAEIIYRENELDIFENEEIKKKIKDLNVQKLIMIGLSTDVSLVFNALSAKKEGYEVYAVVDCSGSYDKFSTDIAIQRLHQNDITIMSWLMVGFELLNDFTNPKGDELSNIVGEAYPRYGNLIELDKKGAKETKTVSEGALNQTIGGEVSGSGGETNITVSGGEGAEGGIIDGDRNRTGGGDIIDGNITGGIIDGDRNRTDGGIIDGDRNRTGGGDIIDGDITDGDGGIIDGDRNLTSGGFLL